MKKGKRILAWLLTLAMLVTVMPDMRVRAEENTTTEDTTGNEGGSSVTDVDAPTVSSVEKGENQLIIALECATENAVISYKIKKNEGDASEYADYSDEDKIVVSDLMVNDEITITAKATLTGTEVVSEENTFAYVYETDAPKINVSGFTTGSDIYWNTATLSISDANSVTLYSCVDENYAIETASKLSLTSSGYELNAVGTYHLKAVDAVTNETTKKIEIKEDKTAPKATIAYGSSESSEIPSSITFDTYYDSIPTFNVEVTDEESGVPTDAYYKYYTVKVTGESAYTALTPEGLDALSDETDWKSSVDIDANVPDGKYVVYVKATDNVGNVGYISTNGFVVDTTAPVIEGIDDKGKYYGDTRFTVTEEYIYEIMVGNDDVYDIEKTEYTIEAPTEGKKEVTITVTDKAGNDAEMTITVHAGDATAPEITIGTGAPLSGNAGNQGKYWADVVLTVKDDNLTEFYVSNNETDQNAQNIIEELDSDNQYTITAGESAVTYYIKAVDAVKNETTITIEIKEDKTAPVAAIAGNISEWKNPNAEITFATYFKDIPEITVTQNDGNGSGTKELKYYVATDKDDIPEYTSNWLTEIPLFTDGEYVLYVLTEDIAGNYDILSTNGFVVDTTDPTVTVQFGEDTLTSTFVPTEDNYKYAKEIELTVNPADDNGSGIAAKEYRISSEVISEETLKSYTDGWSVLGEDDSKITVGSEGLNFVYIKVTDKAGNTTYFGTTGLVIDTNVPLISEINSTQGVGTDGIYYGAVTFRVNEEKVTVTVTGKDDPLTAVNGKYTIECPTAMTAYTITVTDKAENSVEKNITVKPEDTVHPVITVTSDNQGIDKLYYGTTTLSIQDENLAEVVVDGVSKGLANTCVLIGDGGSHEIIAKDALGNPTTLYVTVRPEDTAAPVIEGIANGKTYCSAKTFIVTETNLASVTINGVPATPAGNIYSLPAGGTYKIIATDQMRKTDTVTVTVNGDHTWNSGAETVKPTKNSEGRYTYTCIHCGEMKSHVIPKTEITVTWGKTLKLSDLLSDTTGFEKVTISEKDKKATKKYFTVNSNGTIKTKINSKVKIKKSVPVNIVVSGKTYKVNIKIQIAAPNSKTMKITKKNWGSSVKYTFKYNFKGATKVQVRCKEVSADALFDRYLSKPKSNSESYVTCPKTKLVKNKLTFVIKVYYGKNVSETYTIRK